VSAVHRFDLPTVIDSTVGPYGVTRARATSAPHHRKFMLTQLSGGVGGGLALPHPRKPIPTRRIRRKCHAFGYSLASGLPVKSRHPPPSPDGHQAAEICADSGRHRAAELPAAGGQDRRQARGAHPELPDAALAEAGAYSTENVGHFALARRRTSFTPDPAIPDWWCTALKRGRRSVSSFRSCEIAEECSQSGGAPPMPSASWWSGRSEVHGRARWRGVRRAHQSARRK